jgi:hypothetical protein
MSLVLTAYLVSGIGPFLLCPAFTNKQQLINIVDGMKDSTTYSITTMSVYSPLSWRSAGFLFVLARTERRQ